MKFLKFPLSYLSILFFLLLTSLFSPTQLFARDLPHEIYGVTTDAISSLNAIVDSLNSFKVRPMVRIVFDEYVPASQYKQAVNKIYPVSFIMGEILDSYYMKDYTLTAYTKRVQQYLDTFGDKVDLYEIGNEINGEWLGPTAAVVAKVSKAYDLVKGMGNAKGQGKGKVKVKGKGKRQNLKTALTLYYNKDCWAKADHEMFTWVKKNIPAKMKEGLDYVLVSFYEDDCNNIKPDWPQVFTQLGLIFPNSKIGFGEVGTKYAAKKESYIKRYYTMKIDHPRYVGGYFWWYFKQDMVPKTKNLWSVLNGLMVP